MFKLLSILAGFIIFISSTIFAQEPIPDGFYSRIVQLAEEDVLNKTEVFSSNGKIFNTDCSGFVSYIYNRAGIDLNKYNQSNSPLLSLGIFQGLEAAGLTYRENDPKQVGDLIFFDNTYDANQNGLWDDPGTHVGIVTQIDENHTITFIHYGSKGLAKAYMNLYYPDETVSNIDGKSVSLNSYLRKSAKGEGSLPDYSNYSAHLFNCFAHIPAADATTNGDIPQ